MVNNMKSSYRRYLLRASLLPLFLIWYPIIAIFGPHQGRAEFYPFFAWNLFSRTAETRTDTVIFVREINHQPLVEPTLFFDLGNHFQSARSKDVRLAKMLDNLVIATRRNNTELSDRLTNVIKYSYMTEARQVKYDVAIIKYKPVVRYLNGEIEKITIIRSDEKTP